MWAEFLLLSPTRGNIRESSCEQRLDSEPTFPTSTLAVTTQSSAGGEMATTVELGDDG